MLCGTMFGLNVIRHRNFETSFAIQAPKKCEHVKKVVKHGRRPDRAIHYAAVTGHFSDVAFAQESMGIKWLGQKELAQAIPPAYTKWIGDVMMKL
jgi:DNA (cytosine-5)-methyltransferase 1